jgi:hypothetical protein
MSCRSSARSKCNVQVCQIVQYNDGEVQCVGMVCDWPQPQPSCLLNILGVVVSGVPYRSLKGKRMRMRSTWEGVNGVIEYCKISFLMVLIKVFGT